VRPYYSRASFCNQRKSNNPHIEEETPKVIIEGSRIFQPEYENVTRYSYSIHEKQQLKWNSISQMQLDETNKVWHGTHNVIDYFKDLNDQQPFNASPTQRRNKLVE
jgi:hypothetical protein